MRTLEERYNFLVGRLRVTDVDHWEGDALLEMSTFCFGFNPEREADQLMDMDAVIELAMDTAESDAEYGIYK